MKLKILASGTYCEFVDDHLPDLKEELKASTGAAVRRVTRFVQLALIGAGRCCKNVAISPDTGVYFASCRGDAQVTSDLLEDLIKRREVPSPLTFVNSVSNAACFHVASVLGLQSRSNFVTNRHDPIAAALKMACVDLSRGELGLALVGSVDNCSLPLTEHRQRIQVDVDAVVGESSHWLLIAPESDPRPARAAIPVVRNFSCWSAMREWLAAESFGDESLLAAGQHLTEADARAICDSTGLRLFNYRDSLPHYDSQTGAALHSFIEERKEPAMLHVNSDPSGRYSVIRIER